MYYEKGVNDADYATTKSITIDGKRKIVWQCPIFKTWKAMLGRCYSIKTQKRQPSYIGCEVCDEWLIFSNFKSWMLSQDWAGKQLDKDILFPGNKIYSPKTCIFVTQRTNTFMLDNESRRGEFLIGVSWHKNRNKFYAGIRDSGKYINLGRYDNELDAHLAWRAAKCEIAKKLACEQTDKRVSDAILNKYGC